jgi:hypothetical protein
MKKLSITTLFLAALVTSFSAQPAQAQIQVSISIGGFYDELEPYGRWVDCRYGDCWVPGRVSRHWQPYSNGEWVYTEYGWTWVSYDPWGDDPYHYGTWVYTDRYGWAWIPGTVWAPAWVTWSYSDDYVGWAPLPPSIAFGASGYYGRPVVMRSTQYVFVPMNRFVGTNVASVRVSPQQSATIFQQTTPVTRFGVSGGIVRNTAIPVETIQRATRMPIQTRSIRDAKTAPRPVTEWMRGDRRQVSVVAPAAVVREAIASRPQAPSREQAPLPGKARGNERINRGSEIQQQPAAPRGEVMPRRRVNQPAPAAPAAPGQPAPETYRGRPETSNAPGNRGRGRRPNEAQPQAAPQQAPPQQAPPPAVQANPGSQVQEQPGRGRGKPDKADKNGKEKKDKDKDKDKEKP